MKNLKERTIKNWVSSVVGLSLMIFAGILVWLKTINWTEFIAFLPFCLGMIYVKDTILGVKRKENENNNK